MNQCILIAVRKLGTMDTVTPNLVGKFLFILIDKTKAFKKISLIGEHKNLCYL